MGGPYVGNAAEFLIKTLFGLYILAVMLRFLLQWVRADYNNPLTQFLVKVTNPLLVPLRRIIPGLSGIDFAAVALLLALQMLQFSIIGFFRGYSFQIVGISVWSFAELLSLAINVFFFSILIQVVISWVNPGLHNPVTSLLYSLNEPLLGRARRLIPPVSGMDLSPIVVMILLQLVSMLFIAPISDLSQRLLV